MPPYVGMIRSVLGLLALLATGCEMVAAVGGGGDAAAAHGGGHGSSDSYEAIMQCMNDTVTYEHRVNNPVAYNWCIVPESSYDVVLFGGLAVVLACMLQGKLASVIVLLAGAALAGLAWPVNLMQLSNSLNIWLGIAPWQLFFYVFLPPLLLDAAVRIDWYMFRKVMVQVVTMAFLVVGAGCALMVPIMLYLLRLKDSGWNWLHACMFGAIVASTDAVAIVSIMKTSGGPKRLRIILEGESLLNDASGLTLFEVFFHQVMIYASNPDEAKEPVAKVVGHVIFMVFQFATIGFVMGWFFGWLTRMMLRVMRRFGAGNDQEVALTLAMAYLAYWITASPCKGSGVVAVAVMGLYGAAKNKWDISVKAESEGTFDGFWETLAFVVNACVFAYAGAATVNFFIRSSIDLYTTSAYTRSELWRTLWMLPIIYVILMLMRLGLTLAFRPLFKAIHGDLTFRDCTFLTMAGLRGGASLIMGQAVVTEAAYKTDQVVKSELVFWTAGFVLLTLVINAPLLPWVLRVTGLGAIPEKQLARRRRAVAALAEHSAAAMLQLKGEEEEMLTGVDWGHVERYCDFTGKLEAFAAGPNPPKPKGGPPSLLERLAAACCACCRRGGDDASSAAPVRGASVLGSFRGGGAAAAATNGGGAAAAATNGGGADANGGAADGGKAAPHGADDDGHPHHARFGWPFMRAGGAPATIEEHHDEEDLGGGDSDAEREGLSLRVISAGPHAGGGRGRAAGEPGSPAGGAGSFALMQQECPLVGVTRLGERRAGGSADERPAAPSGGAAAMAAGARAWGRIGSGGRQERPQAAAAPAAAPAAGPTAAAAAPRPAGGEGAVGDAYSAALMARSARTRAVQEQAAAAAAAAKPRAPLLRGLATRSAAPHLGGGGGGGGTPALQVQGSVSGQPAPWQVPPGGDGAQGSGTNGSGRAAAGGAGGGGASAFGGDPMERALGRPSRSLAARSVNIASTYGGSDAAPPPFAAAALGGGAAGHSDSDIVRHHGGGGSPPRVPRGLATRSVGFPGYPLEVEGGGGGGGAGLPPPGLPSLARRSATGAPAGGGGAGPPPPALPGLARRSATGALGGAGLQGAGGGAPHMAPIAPALGRISTGLAAAYAPGGGGGGGGYMRGDLHACSVPVSQLARVSRPLARGSTGPQPSAPLGRTSPAAVLGRFSPMPPDAGAEGGSGSKGAWRERLLRGGGSSARSGRDPNEEELADARMWLVSGLKRYFHAKRMQGLLSARGLRILDHGCDTLLDDPYRPLELWDVIDGDATSKWVVNTATYGLFLVRRASVWLMHPRLGRGGRLLSAPLRLLAAFLQRPLNKVLLLGVEVGMEYLLSLTASPYVQWLQTSDMWGALLGEITAETAAVWQWLMDREVEAPERYSAVQSYRAAMAVLRQQQHFLEDLFESGMIDSLERSQMMAPIEAQERALELTGPVWRAPGLKAVLGQLPFLRGQPATVLTYLMRYGHLLMLGSGASLPEDGSLYVVMSGIVAVSYAPLLGGTQDYFLGTGGVYNLYTALTGDVLPGRCGVSARGNALGKGPVLFCLTSEGVANVKRLAADGDERFAQMELDMYRLAGLLLVERMHQQFEVEATQALVRAAPDEEPEAAGADQGGRRGAAPGQAARRAAWARARLPRVFDAVTRALGAAELLHLPAGGVVSQGSSVLLLKGALQAAPEMPEGGGDATRDALRWLCSAGRHQGQGLLPAMWEVLGPEDVAAAPAHMPRQQPRVTLTAGPDGATLLVCPAAGFEPPAAAAAPGAGPAPPAPGVDGGGAALLPPLVGPPGGPPLGGIGLAAAPSALDLMMPPLAGVAGRAPYGGPPPGPSPGRAPPAAPASPTGAPPPPPPGGGGGGPDVALAAGGVGRITEEDARPDSAAALGGPPRRFAPLDARGALRSEKRLPFSGGGAGPL
ncbi:MAG: Sodium/hydrogen exchanger family-domain-containing protein [Monoraphidium minutum]|nr:MAG: Sodium/hydrogen exchanger family-domain-containing protein [Monoraphidium minutum]